MGVGRELIMTTKVEEIHNILLSISRDEQRNRFRIISDK